MCCLRGRRVVVEERAMHARRREEAKPLATDVKDCGCWNGGSTASPWHKPAMPVDGAMPPAMNLRLSLLRDAATRPQESARRPRGYARTCGL
jgi:hypothetical protein